MGAEFLLGGARAAWLAPVVGDFRARQIVRFRADTHRATVELVFDQVRFFFAPLDRVPGCLARLPRGDRVETPLTGGADAQLPFAGRRID
jgi:hypothetical protein